MNLDLNYFDHIKAMRLESKLGNGTDVLPIRLWAYVGKQSPQTGRLKMLDAEVERICRWWGRKGEMISAMIEIGFLERDGEFVQVHDWFDHSGHLATFKKRAIKANRIRWKNHKKLRTPTRTPKTDIKDSSCSAVHSSAVQDSSVTPTAGVVSAAPYERPDKGRDPIAFLVMTYKEGLGVPFDDRPWDKQFWSRWSAAAKVILDSLGNVDDAVSYLQFQAKQLAGKDLSWSLKTVADRAVLYAAKKRGKNESPHRKRVPGTDAESGTGEESGGLRALPSGGAILDAVRGRKEVADGN